MQMNVDLYKLADGKIVTRIRKDIKSGKSTISINVSAHVPTGNDSALLQMAAMPPAQAAAMFLSLVLDSGTIEVDMSIGKILINLDDIAVDQKMRKFMELPDVILEKLRREVLDHMDKIYSEIFGEEFIRNLSGTTAPSSQLRGSGSIDNGSMEISEEMTRGT